MDHEDDPDDPIVLVDPPGRKTRRAKFDPRYPRVRAPAALLELKSWALRDFVVATGVGVLVDTAKEAAAFAVSVSTCRPGLGSLDAKRFPAATCEP